MTTQTYEKELMQNILTAIENHGGRVCLSSVILTGSFGREEPTYIVAGDGELVLVSDVEIGLVYPKATAKRTVKRLIEEVSREFKEDLNLMAIHEKRVRKVYNYNMSFKTPRYKTLFTFDLFNGSKTIWGEDLISAKKVCLSEVDRYEAKKLIANRIGELVYLQSCTDSEERRQNLAIQWKGKLILAIASAWLICEGLYVSPHRQQHQILKENKDTADEVFGKGFFEAYDKAFSYLRNNGTPYMIEDGDLREFVRRANQYLTDKNVGKSKVMTISQWVKYYVRYVKTGMRYGMVGFADNIMQALIDGYGADVRSIEDAALAWRKVLY